MSNHQRIQHGDVAGTGCLRKTVEHRCSHRLALPVECDKAPRVFHEMAMQRLRNPRPVSLYIYRVEKK